jgi:RimJ/RimL family protein N-acetyltransferase
MSALRLVPFTATALPVIEPWFDDEQTRRWLGDRRWPSMILRLAASPPVSGASRAPGVLNRCAWIVDDDGAPAGLVDVEVYEDRTAGLAFVIAPARRGTGVGRCALHAIVEQLAAEGIREVFGGAEANNLASIRCMESAGFTRRSPEPDADGFLYLYLARHLSNATG